MKATSRLTKLLTHPSYQSNMKSLFNHYQYNIRSCISTKSELDKSLQKMIEAQRKFALLPQSKTDQIFQKVAAVASEHRVQFAQSAFNETGLGVLEDKIIKNHVSTEFVYHKWKDMKTCGVIYQNDAEGIQRIAQPVGPIAAYTPITNPTSTVMFKTLISLKTRNCVLFSPHPKAKNSCSQVIDILRDVAIAAGAPENCIDIIREPTLDLASYLMHHEDVKYLLATGGVKLCQACMTSGKPCLTGGPGNTPVIVDETAAVKETVHSLILSKTFDNGTLCPSEQTVFIHEAVYEDVLKEFATRGIYVISKDNQSDVNKIKNILKKYPADISSYQLNEEIVGQKASVIASRAGISIPEYFSNTSMICVECDADDILLTKSNILFAEKLSPVLTLVKVKNTQEGIAYANKVLNRYGGVGHTSSYFTDENADNNNNQYKINEFKRRMPTRHCLVNMPASLGCVGDIYNFSENTGPALTIGCGVNAGNSFAGNLSPDQLIETKVLLNVRENMAWLKNPPKIYFKYGILNTAIEDLNKSGLKNAFIVSGPVMTKLGIVEKLQISLENHGIKSIVYNNIPPNPTKDCILDGVEEMNINKPDHIIALGGGSPMDAAKVMRLLYEYPDIHIEDLYTRFLDIQKRINDIPDKYTKCRESIMIPTTSGTGSEVTPFAVITDNHQKYPICSYSMTPSMAIVDSELCMTMPPKLTADTGIDALVHAIESYISICATDYTKPNSLHAIELIYKHLPICYKDPYNIESRQIVHNASCIAGLAFSNAFLGICHSLAHALSSEYDQISHGLANALLVSQIIEFNGADNPYKSTPFAQYRKYTANDDYKQIANIIDFGNNGYHGKGNAQRLIQLMEELKQKIDIPLSIQEYGIDENNFKSKIDNMALAAWDDQCTGTNPRAPLIDEIKQIYMNAYYGMNNMKKK